MITSVVVPKDGEHSGPVLEWTGERYVTSVGGEIEFEHTHRYLFAMPFAKGATVLDIASGEGYGSALLASVAHRVIGLDIDENSIAHAISKYKYDNVAFIRGTCVEIPLKSDSIDIAISFETLEHILNHDKFLRELSRVLKPNGVLIISTPDRVLYNGPGGHNPYHLKELDRAEFKLLLKRYFKSVQLLGQSYLEGSVIDPLKRGSSEDGKIKTSKRWLRYIEEPVRARKSLARSIYLIGVASNQSLPKGPTNFLTAALGRQPRLHAIRRAQNAEQTTTREVDQLRAMLAAAEDQQRALSEMVAERGEAAEALQAEIKQRMATEAGLQAELELVGSKLADTEQRLHEGEAVTAALQGEICRLRSALSAAEGHRQQSDVANATLRAEICSALSELAAARDVGRAALASLRTEDVPQPNMRRETRWLRLFPRRFGLRWRNPLSLLGCHSRSELMPGLLFRRRSKPSSITLADRARDAGQWHVAAAYYRKALRRSPRNSPIWVQYGHTLKQSGHLAEAERAYRTAVAYNPRSGDSYLQLGAVLRIQGKRQQAEAAYLRALVLDPSLNGPSLELSQLGWSETHLSELHEKIRIIHPAEEAVNLTEDEQLLRQEKTLNRGLPLRTLW